MTRKRERDAIEDAWGIIANVDNGDSGKQSETWTQARNRWWHTYMCPACSPDDSLPWVEWAVVAVVCGVVLYLIVTSQTIF